MKISGKNAYYKFKELCSDFGIDLSNYEENDEEKAYAVKETIPDAKICFSSDRIEQIGIRKGIEQGALKTLYELYTDNLISLQEAARRASLSEKDFLGAAQNFTH